MINCAKIKILIGQVLMENFGILRGVIYAQQDLKIDNVK